MKSAGRRDQEADTVLIKFNQANNQLFYHYLAALSKSVVASWYISELLNDSTERLS